MKKKTVITTEKHEFWVIRRPPESSQENDDEAARPQKDSQGEKRSLAVLIEQPQPEDTPHLENECSEEGV